MHLAPIHILGGGAMGFPLAAHLIAGGREVTVIRTSSRSGGGRVNVCVRGDESEFTMGISTVSLKGWNDARGLLVVTTKSFANEELARRLRQAGAEGPVVILQNGLHVERPFVEAGFPEIHRGVLYMTGQPEGPGCFRFRAVRSSPLGLVQGTPLDLQACVDVLSTDGFPFHAEKEIDREVLRKTILNAVFNSICPLLDADNGVFGREEAALELARGVVRECLSLADRQGIDLTEEDLIEGVLQISRGSAGILISTLQDLRAGRPTEIKSLNLELARIARQFDPPIRLPVTEALGRLIALRESGGSQRGNW